MTPEKLRQIYGTPSKASQEKILFQLDDHCKNFIKNSPFLILGSSGGNSIDLSPKGDSRGFVNIIDNNTLILPDRSGNNRIDGLLNLLKNQQISLLFLIPNLSETLRIKGTGRITDDGNLCKHFAVNNRTPKTVTIVTISTVFFHCGKALSNAKIWDTKSWHKNRPIPSLKKIISDQKN